MLKYTIDAFIEHLSDGPACNAGMVEDGQGEWVRHADAQAEIDALRTPWQTIDTVPLMQQVMLCNNNAGNKWMSFGFIHPNSGPGYATHWMPVPELPPNAHAQRRV